jgi:hypothetical protein
MAEILVVEGLTDAVFFQELLIRLYLREFNRETRPIPGREHFPSGVTGLLRDDSTLEVGFRYTEDRPPGGISQIPPHIRALLETQVLTFVVAADIDDRTPDQVLQSITRVVCTHLGIPTSKLSVRSHTLALEGGSVTAVPVGLYQDPLQAQLGVSRHAVEDYLTKLILEDAGLRQECPELGQLLSEIIPVIQKHDGNFDSSKELFQLIKPMVKHGFSDVGVVQKVIRDCDEAILRAVLAPILDDLESGLGLNP